MALKTHQGRVLAKKLNPPPTYTKLMSELEEKRRQVIEECRDLLKEVEELKKMLREIEELRKGFRG